MSSSRKSGSPWLFLLVLVCSLLGRPLHDAWHIAHPLGESEGAATLVSVVADDMRTTNAGDFQNGLQEDLQDGLQDAAQEDGDGVKSDACAWCLFHAQAAATGRAPDALLSHAEADAPPVVLSREPLRSLDWTVAKPRGPPSA